MSPGEVERRSRANNPNLSYVARRQLGRWMMILDARK
jgi:hypothetical protein